jgi:hypothetical protein
MAGDSGSEDSQDGGQSSRKRVKTAYELQRLNLEKLMKNPVNIVPYIFSN